MWSCCITRKFRRDAQILSGFESGTPDTSGICVYDTFTSVRKISLHTCSCAGCCHIPCSICVLLFSWIISCTTFQWEKKTHRQNHRDEMSWITIGTGPIGYFKFLRLSLGISCALEASIKKESKMLC